MPPISAKWASGTRRFGCGWRGDMQLLVTRGARHRQGKGYEKKHSLAWFCRHQLLEYLIAHCTHDLQRQLLPCVIIASCVARSIECSRCRVPVFGFNAEATPADHALHGRSQRPFVAQTLKDHEPDDHGKTEDAAMAALQSNATRPAPTGDTDSKPRQSGDGS